jgi:hypothetical protein
LPRRRPLKLGSAGSGLEVPTPTTPTEWIPLDGVQPGDRVKVPGFSSWAIWASREYAEISGQPFRELVERIDGWFGKPDLIRLVFADGYACQFLAEARVLRRG